MNKNYINTIVLRAESDADIFNANDNGDYAFGDKKLRLPQYKHNRLIIKGEKFSLIAFGPEFVPYDSKATKFWQRNATNRMWKGLASWDKARIVPNDQLDIISDIESIKINKLGREYRPAIVQGGIGYCWSTFRNWANRMVK
jgi:hypothetical protein